MADVVPLSPARWPFVGFRSLTSSPNLANQHFPFAVGTASLINPAVALTAAHVVYDTFSGYGGLARSVDITFPRAVNDWRCRIHSDKRMDHSGLSEQQPAITGRHRCDFLQSPTHKCSICGFWLWRRPCPGDYRRRLHRKQLSSGSVLRRYFVSNNLSR